MDHESEVIMNQMEQTRSSLAEKLETLEEHLTSTVLSTTEAVSGTVEAVKEAVEDTVSSVTESVETVKETVTSTFDLNRQMQEHPWIVLGGGVVVGYLGASLLPRAGRALSGAAAPSSAASYYSGPDQAPPATAPWTNGNAAPRYAGYAGPQQSGLWGRLAEAFAPAISQLQGLALGVGVSLVGKVVLDKVPESLRPEVEKVIAEINRAVGAKPLPDFLHEHPNQERTEAGSHR